MRSPIRVAIAGTGFIGKVHARSARLAGAQLVGVAASSHARALAAAAELGAEQAFTSAEALVQAPDVDVVHICTPNSLHAPLVHAALAAGKHVICEKPLSVDVDSARSLAEAAEASGLQATVPFVYRYYPTVREARERVRTGATGPLHLLHGTYLQDWLLTSDDNNWRVDGTAGGASRAFADIGSHWCDLAEFISGHRIVRLSASARIVHPERRRVEHREAFARLDDASGEPRAVNTEDAVIVQFETDRGAAGSLVVSQVSPGRKNRLWIELDGSKEALVFDQENPETLWCGRRSAATILYRDPAVLSPAAARLATLPGGHPQGYADCFDGFVADSYEAIRTGVRAEGLPVFADGLRGAQLTAAVLTSAYEGGWVEVQVGASVP